VRAGGDGPAVELGVQPGNEPAEVCPSTTGKPQQHVLQTVSRHQRITAVARHRWVWQNAPGLPQIPPALHQGSGNSPRPQTLFFQLPDRYASRRGHAADPADRDPSPGPPTLCAQPSRTPTRHQPRERATSPGGDPHPTRAGPQGLLQACSGSAFAWAVGMRWVFMGPCAGSSPPGGPPPWSAARPACRRRTGAAWSATGAGGVFNPLGRPSLPRSVSQSLTPSAAPRLPGVRSSRRTAEALI
jgi:hypothetical protein